MLSCVEHEKSFTTSGPRYPNPVCSELENSIRVAVGDCSVTERRRWRPPYQTGKTVHVHAKTLQTHRGRTHGAGCALPWFRTAEPLGERHYENWITTTASLMTEGVIVCNTNGRKTGHPQHMFTPYVYTGLWLRTGCVTNAQVSFFERTGF